MKRELEKLFYEEAREAIKEIESSLLSLSESLKSTTEIIKILRLLKTLEHTAVLIRLKEISQLAYDCNSCSKDEACIKGPRSLRSQRLTIFQRLMDEYHSFSTI